MMKTSQASFAAVMVLSLGAMLAACSPPDVPTSAAEDGRARLNASNSYAQIGEYVVHVNAMTSDTLTPDVAASYGITRAEDQGLINLVVLRKADEPGMDTPVSATVAVSAANLTGQSKSLELREIQDGISIYHIGTLRVDNRETINFDFDIRPKDSNRTLLVRFSHEFYTR